jgi:hypothetical protein
MITAAAITKVENSNMYEGRSRGESKEQSAYTSGVGSYESDYVDYGAHRMTTRTGLEGGAPRGWRSSTVSINTRVMTAKRSTYPMWLGKRIGRTWWERYGCLSSSARTVCAAYARDWRLTSTLALDVLLLVSTLQLDLPTVHEDSGAEQARSLGMTWGNTSDSQRKMPEPSKRDPSIE